MTWILPKQLHTLASALDTEALISDLNEQSNICAQSLLLRSKPSPARIWLRKWKRDSWTQHLSGRILRPSLGLAFAERLASSLEATLASHSVPPANDSEQTTRDISGHSSQLELLPCDQESASLKTSRGTFLWDSSKSYETFKDLVIAARSEYSARLKSARRINESGYSSWPTIRASEYKDTGPVGSKSHSHMLAKGYLCAVVTAGPADQDDLSSAGSRRELLWPTHTNTGTGRVSDGKRGRDLESCITNPESWPTPSAMEAEKAGNYAQGQMGNSLSAMAKRGELMAWATPECKNHVGYQVGADGTKYLRLGSQVEQWATPKASDPQHSGPNMRDSAGNYALPAQAVRESWATPNVPNGGRTTLGDPENPRKKQVMLHHQVGQWATPIAGDWKGQVPSHGEPRMLSGVTEKAHGGKLNPRWVETLMGLPVGWTMPSCASPVTPEWTSSDCSATASCQQQPSEPLTS